MIWVYVVALHIAAAGYIIWDLTRPAREEEPWRI
jgi:hypothetical protein